MMTNDKPTKTFILFWNTAISSYTLQRLEDDIEFNTLNDDFDWSVREHQFLNPGDRFFMVRCKNKPVPGQLNRWGKQLWEPVFDEHTGVCMSGVFTSEPFPAPDWSGRGREVFYAKMNVETVIHPDDSPLLESATLMKDIPGFDWTGGASGRVIDEAWADKLQAMWVEFCDRHEENVWRALPYMNDEGVILQMKDE